MELYHSFAVTAFLINPLFVKDATVALENDPGLINDLEIIARRILSALFSGEDPDAVIAS